MLRPASEQFQCVDVPGIAPAALLLLAELLDSCVGSAGATPLESLSSSGATELERRLYGANDVGIGVAGDTAHFRRRRSPNTNRSLDGTVHLSGTGEGGRRP